MYIENSRGLKTEPCGTPYFTVLIEMIPRLNKQKTVRHVLMKTAVCVVYVTLSSLVSSG